MTTENETSEVDTLVSEPKRLTLTNGAVVEVSRIKIRQLFKLLKVLSSGDTLGVISLYGDVSNEEFSKTLVFAMLTAIPEAEEESIDFIRSLVAPVVPHPEGSRLTSAQIADNAEAMAKFSQAMENPDLDDFVDILIPVVQTEAPHIKALAKKLGALLEAQQKSLEAKASSKPKSS